MERSHPPLRRVLRGSPAKVDPTLDEPEAQNGKESPPQPMGELVQRKAEMHLTAHSSRSLGDNASLSTCEQDSCYSSCSEESHASLSRESSDALSTDMNRLKLSMDSLSREALTPLADVPSELVEFANSLGYSEAQLENALRTVGAHAGQDRILAELIKQGRCEVPKSSRSQPPALRSIVIDGSNIAMTHGRKEVFSCAGIRQCVRFFTERGHQDVLVFIPQFRRETARADSPITDQHFLAELDGEGRIVWTPSRRINGRRIVCHDDRYILKTAEEKDAVIVSNDEYRDLIRESPQYKRLVENRLLMYSFVDGKFMPPDDPLGRHGPKLDQFLSKGSQALTAQLCPYARKCTYGNKCKYFHPERPNGLHISVTDRLMKEKNNKMRPSLQSRPSMVYEQSPINGLLHQSVARTQSLNIRLEQRLANQENTPLSHTNRLLPPSALPSWHNQLTRNQSAPLGAQLRQHEPCSSTSRANSLLDVGLFSGPPPGIAHPAAQSRSSLSHMFSPSPAVWGQSEYSVGPLNQGTSLDEADSSRARLQYHLSQLFPSSAVCAVMAAHPEESDPQRLCERILAFHKGFNS